MPKHPHRMPRCTAADVAPVMAAIEALPPAQRRLARAFAEEVTPRELCAILHAIRRWYQNQTGALAARLLAHREALGRVMDLSAPLGAYRGFKVLRNDPLAEARPGEEWALPVTRNGACSSWSLQRAGADRFSGRAPGKVGLVVTLTGGEDLQPFLAPPSRTEAWFDALYERAMNRSYRYGVEEEVALHAASVDVRIEAVKR